MGHESMPACGFPSKLDSRHSVIWQPLLPFSIKPCFFGVCRLASDTHLPDFPQPSQQVSPPNVRVRYISESYVDAVELCPVCEDTIVKSTETQAWASKTGEKFSWSHGWLHSISVALWSHLSSSCKNKSPGTLDFVNHCKAKLKIFILHKHVI